MNDEILRQLRYDLVMQGHFGTRSESKYIARFKFKKIKFVKLAEKRLKLFGFDFNSSGKEIFLVSTQEIILKMNEKLLKFRGEYSFNYERINNTNKGLRDE